MAAFFEIKLDAGCTNDRKFTPLDAAGDTIAADSSDVLRFKIGRADNSTPTIELNSTTDTANDSGISITTLDPLVIVVRIAQADMTLFPGIYRGVLGIVDDSETDPANAFKMISQGIVYVVGNLGGDIGQ